MWKGKSMTSFEAPAEMQMYVTTADSPMYTNSYYYQTEDGKNKEPRNAGRWVNSFVDGHAKTVMYGAYDILGTYIQMPKSLVDANRLCASNGVTEGEAADAGGSPFVGMKCVDINAYVIAIRTAH
jgi:hypothetical protein